MGVGGQGDCVGQHTSLLQNLQMLHVELPDNKRRSSNTPRCFIVQIFQLSTLFIRCSNNLKIQLNHCHLQVLTELLEYPVDKYRVSLLFFVINTSQWYAVTHSSVLLMFTPCECLCLQCIAVEVLRTPETCHQHPSAGCLICLESFGSLQNFSAIFGSCSDRLDDSRKIFVNYAVDLPKNIQSLGGTVILQMYVKTTEIYVMSN